MSLTIKQRGDTWRLVIEGEEWAFTQRQELDHVLHDILNLKEKHGRLHVMQRMQARNSCVTTSSTGPIVWPEK